MYPHPHLTQPGARGRRRHPRILPAIAMVAFAATTAAETSSGEKCIAEVALQAGGYTLGCTANDIRIASAEILPDEYGNLPRCAYAGADVTFKARFTVESSATERYDIGLWFAEDGDPNKDGALTGKCSVSTLPVSGYEGGVAFINIDGTSQPGDTCGDIKKPSNNPLYPVVTMTATCVDYDAPGTPGHGKLDLPYCTSWRQSGSNELCTTPVQAYPGAPSKCKCDRTFDVPIDVPEPKLRVVKTPAPAEVKEPGGNVEFKVQVYNDSIDPKNTIDLDSMTDTILGQLTQQSLGSVFSTNSYIKSTTCEKSTVATGTPYECKFTLAVRGGAGSSIKDRVDVGGHDTNGKPVDGSAEATVSITDERPDITVEKSADIDSVREPGGYVTYTVKVTNTSPADQYDPIRINSLVDDKFGNLTNAKDSTCNSTGNPYPVALPVGQSYACTFSAYVAGNGKTVTAHTNVITANVSDDDGGAPYSEDSNPVTVAITPVTSAISVEKQVWDGSAWVKAAKLAEGPARDVSYRVVITNESLVDDVTINSLTEKVNLNGVGFGSAYNLASNCSVPLSIAKNSSVTCSFKLPLQGNAGDSHVNEVTASGQDDDKDPVGGASSASVEFEDVVPGALLRKTAQQAFTVYVVEVTNTSSAEPLFISTLVDDKFGDITDKANENLESTNCEKGAEVGSGKTYTCAFSAAVINDGNGVTHVNKVTALLSDDDNNDVEASDTAKVVLE